MYGANDILCFVLIAGIIGLDLSLTIKIGVFFTTQGKDFSSMQSPEIRQTSRQRPLFRIVALWLALGVCLVAASGVFLFWQGQHTNTPMHAIYVAYGSYARPVKKLSDLVDNPVTLRVAALDPHNGKRIWQTDLLTFSVESKGGASDSPGRPGLIAAGSMVYAFTSTKQQGIVIALDAHTGTVLWKYIQNSNPIINVKTANGSVYIQEGQKNLQVLDGGSGRSLWQISAGTYDYIGSMAFSSQAVYIVEEGFGKSPNDPSYVHLLRALRTSDGTEIWRGAVDKTDNTVPYQLQVDDQRVYLLKPSYESGGVNLPGTVVALHILDGSTLWTYHEQQYSEADFSYFAHSLDGQTLYLPAFNSMTAIDAQDGKLLWTYKTPNEMNLFVPKDRLYGYVDEAKYFCSLNLKDGTKRWCTSVQPGSGISVGTENLYFLGYQGSGEDMMVLRQSDGQVVGQYQIGDPRRTFLAGFAVEE